MVKRNLHLLSCALAGCLFTALLPAIAAQPALAAVGENLLGERCELRERDDVAAAAGLPADQHVYCEAKLAGQVYYDRQPTLRYRQHHRNLVGSNVSLSSRFARIAMLWRGRFKDLNDRHFQALDRISHHLTSANKEILDEFRAATAREVRQGLGPWVWRRQSR